MGIAGCAAACATTKTPRPAADPSAASSTEAEPGPWGFAPREGKRELARESEILSALTEETAGKAIARLVSFPPAGEDISSGWLEAMRSDVVEQGWQPGPPPRAEEMGWREGPEAILAHLSGQEWPDQWILIGGGGSAGDISPAVLYEVARVLGERASDGWRPRRTLVMLAPATSGRRRGGRSWSGSQDRLPVPPLAYIEGEATAGGEKLLALTTPPLLSWAQDIVRHVGSDEARTVLLTDWAARPGDAEWVRDFLGSGIPILRLGIDPGNTTGSVLPPGRLDVALVASAMSIAALRMADTTLPPHDHASGAIRALDGLIDLSDRAEAAYDGNPPPTSVARIALGQLRAEAEAWRGAATHWLAGIRRSNPLASHEEARRAGRAGSLLLAAGSTFHDYVEKEPSPGCRNLLLCPAPGGSGGQLISLPGMEQALSAGDRAALAAETVRLAAAAALATARLAEARRTLTTPPAPQAPGGD
jgi:hypothetical protein